MHACVHACMYLHVHMREKQREGGGGGRERVSMCLCVCVCVCVCVCAWMSAESLLPVTGLTGYVLMHLFVQTWLCQEERDKWAEMGVCILTVIRIIWFIGLMVQPIIWSSNKCDFNSVKLNSWAVPSYQVARNMTLARDKRSMCCTWFAHDCAWATWAYMLETVCSAVRRL